MKNSFLKHNIKALKNKQYFIDESILKHSGKLYDIIIETTKDKNKIFYMNFLNTKLYFHSRYNPEEEAKIYIQKSNYYNCNLIFLIGLGFGYHAKELINVINENQRIVIIEPNINIFYESLVNIDLYEIFSDNRVFFHLYQDNYSYTKFIENILNEIDCYFNNESILMLITPPYMQVHKTTIENMIKCINDSLIHIQVTRNTIIELSYTWLENYLNNIKYLKHSINIESFFDKFCGVPAYIISAGPSLNKNILELKKLKNKGIIFSSYSALKVLLDNDIKPDFVVSLDGKQLNYETQDQLNKTFDIPLIYSPFVDNNLLKKHTGIKINYVLSYDNYSKYINDKLNIFYKSIYTAGTIAATIMDISYLMGCNPIIFVGQDLAFTNNKRHAIGTNYDNCIEKEKEMIKKQGSINTKDIYGHNIKTNYIFMQYKKGIEEYIYRKKNNCSFIDATEGGAYIEGTSVFKLSEVISKYSSINKIDVNNIIKDIFNCNKFKSTSYMSAILEDIKRSAKELQQLTYLLDIFIKEIKYYNKDSNNIDLILNKIEIYNNKIDIFSENSKLFQLIILGIVYFIQRESYTKSKDFNYIDFFILNSVDIYKKVISLYEGLRNHFENICLL